MELEKNTLLHGGTYRIEKALGQGSFGITYLANHTALNRKVAIKEFFMKELNTRGEDGSISGMTDGSLSYNYGQKFKKEAMNLSQLDHPNIVRVTDSFEENGTYYYVMDYIEGENLNDYLKHNAISQQEAVSIITDVAKALQYMHDTKHMLHLDLKPGNIMRRASDGHIFLIDFGLSKHYSNSGQPETSTTIGLGTPGYAPIEQSNQAKNGEFRPTIDVYAIGATLYKLLTRETPPPASDIVSDDELVEDKLRANGITGNIIDVVVNAMLPNVKKRTQTIKAFVNALNYNSSSSNTASSATSAPKEEVNPVNEETCIIGQSNPSIEKIASVKPQAFNIDQYNIPSHYLADPKNTENLAMKGNPEAMFAFAMMYLRGEGKFQNFEVAHKWLHKCKANGDGRAEVLLKNWEWLKKKYISNNDKKLDDNVREKQVKERTLSSNPSSNKKFRFINLFICVFVFFACCSLFNTWETSDYIINRWQPLDGDKWRARDLLVQKIVCETIIFAVLAAISMHTGYKYSMKRYYYLGMGALASFIISWILTADYSPNVTNSAVIIIIIIHYSSLAAFIIDFILKRNKS